MPRFEDLPVEIIDLIFYPIFLPYPEAWPRFLTYMAEPDVEAFISLTGTSKLCRSLALPILFHAIRITYKAEYIFNMFESHRDLTKLTKALTLPFDRHSDSDYSDVQNTASRLGLGGPVLQSIRDGRPQTAEVNLALALCSNVETLRIRLPDHSRKTDWSNRLFRTTFDLFTVISSELGTVPYLESLRYLAFDTRSHRCHREPLSDVALFDIPRLLALTPKLEVLVLSSYCAKFYQIGEPFDVDVCRPALESLIEIKMWEWPLTSFEDNDINVIREVLTATTRLRKFVYASRSRAFDRWREEHPPRRLITMLQPVQSTLQYLKLDYGRKILLPRHEDRFGADEMVIAPAQLQRFTHLETLEISQCVYCHHQYNRKAEGATYLADLLPLTIRRLTIYFPRHYGGVPCLDCILYLGQRVVAGDFPALERVEIKAHFLQRRMKGFGHGYRRQRRARRWTAEDSARKTLTYDKELAGAARREEGRKEKVIEAFSGSGVEIRYRAWQSVTEEEGFEVLDT
jgi:hypothetical protein